MARQGNTTHRVHADDCSCLCHDVQRIRKQRAQSRAFEQAAGGSHLKLQLCNLSSTFQSRPKHMLIPAKRFGTKQCPDRVQSLDVRGW